MQVHIKVTFGPGRDYEFRFPSADLADGTAEAARHWFEEQFNALDCQPLNPLGKVLVLDRILCVAREMGERPFASADTAAQTFARNVALALRRDTVTVDLAALAVG